MSVTGLISDGFDGTVLTQNLSSTDTDALIVGPGPNLGTSVVGNIVTWNNTTGTLVKDSGVSISASTGDKVVYQLLPFEAVAISTTYTTIAYFPWKITEHNGYSSGKVVFSAITDNRILEVQLYDLTNATSLGSASVPVSSDDTYSFNVTNPGGNARLALQIRKTTVAGVEPRVLGTTLEYSN